MRINREVILACLCAGLLSAGCAHHREVVVRDSQPVVVVQEPPAPRIETRPTSPGSGYAWVPGYWAWDGKRYAWRPGEWVLMPRSGAVWVDGHWERHANGWTWTPGHWM